MILSALGFAASVDIELMQNGLGLGRAPGVPDTPALGLAGWEIGLLAMGERAPLRVVHADEPDALVVSWRAASLLEGRIGLSRAVHLRLRVPMSYDEAGDADAVATRTGFAAGDPGLGVGLGLSPWAPVRFGTWLDVRLPFSAGAPWRGEEEPRVQGGLAAGGRLRTLEADLALGLSLRSPVDTGAGAPLGSTLEPAGSLAWSWLPDRAWLRLGALGRMSLAPGVGPAAEAYAGLGAAPRAGLRLEGFGGVGLLDGPGAASWRAGLALSVSHRAPERVRVGLPLPSGEDLPDEAPPAPVVARRGIARLEGDQILVTEPLRFVYASPELLPESEPVLTAVAELLRAHPEILHVVIEGHASEEGGFAYNYRLADGRASAVFQALVTRAVAAERLSCRSYGEVAPTGATERALDRRVVFRVTRWASGQLEAG